ncbi:AprI/Inh family metalloprotease inhibitor [Undibacter mobilis]|uniref:Alkaline proteinase inhibitor/ Outer membrane lipoprotein Omp19 domain-containing protein n=1 Tax=Undibacter mobilis TaxID=2292256 RepID=A0A371BAK7_9BRAD|nr:AprI/Inh family metalloprotease inhibitor [Undibacter mobilis]RDV04391.1 hypothetical protein DXH78_07275 [Undibacter mobilis]
MTAQRIVLLLLACLALSPVQAQPAGMGDAAKALIGSWEFSNADRDRRCTATFTNAPVVGGYKVEFDANCAALFPFVANVSGWRYPDNDNLFLFDAAGKTLAEFSEVEAGMFEAPTPGVGVLFLQNAAAAAPPPKRPEEVAGDWIIAGQATLCELSLSVTAASGGALRLTVKPGCREDIAKLNFTRWRIEGGELQLLPAQGTTPWRFVENDSDNWRRIPETNEPVNLIRR